MISRTINIIAITLLFLLATVYIIDFSSESVKTVNRPSYNYTPPAREVVPEPEPPPIEDNMETRIFSLVNMERQKEGLQELVWDEKIASVAREHSENLAKENEDLTQKDLLCPIPLVHHEGFDFGLYHDDRLENRGIYDFLQSGENIFLVSSWDSRRTNDVDEVNCTMPAQPEGDGVEDELMKRLEEAENMQRVDWTFHYADNQSIEKSIVVGWMNSELHRKNILMPGYSHSGIGISKVNDFYIVVQVFIEKIDCGYHLGPCCPQNNTLYCYQPATCLGTTCVIKE